MAQEPMTAGMTAEAPIGDLIGRSLGEFIIREQIGEGGHAVVYRCEQPVLKREAVIKVLHRRRRRNDSAQERFLREAQLASSLDHPDAAHVYAFGAEEDGALWIAMELVQGVDLGRWLKTHGPMSLAQFVPFFERITDVVHAAHERKIVHRDLKPSNVMVIERAGRLFPKLLDFGIAKASTEVAPAVPEVVRASAPTAMMTARLRGTRSAQHTRTDSTSDVRRLTRSGSRMGSAPYMSPEQWSNTRDVGPAADVYSLGILAYEALTGRTPFVAESADGYYWQHLSAEVPGLGSDFSPALDRVIQRALAKKPEARHANVLELASALRAALRAQPREQLRSLAQVWEDRARSPALLLKGRDLQRAPTGVTSDIERAFVAASQRHAARSLLIRRCLAVSAAAIVLGAVWYRVYSRPSWQNNGLALPSRLRRPPSRKPSSSAVAPRCFIASLRHRCT